MSGKSKRIYEFGSFRLDPVERLLLRAGEVVPMAPKAFETLLALVERHGRVWEKDDLIKRIWPDTFVEEGNLAQHIFTLRRALSDGQNGSQYIETIPRRGYRFVAEVREERDDTIDEDHTRASAVIDSGGETNAAGGEPRGKIKPGSAVMVMAVLLSLIALTAALTRLRISSRSEERGPAVRSLAVLPFKMIGGEGSDDRLGLGMTDALITRLGNLKQVSVRPTNSVRNFAAPGQDPLAAGRELKVEAVLDGNIQRVGDRLRLTAQLIGVRDGAPLWSGKFDERFNNIFAAQDAVSERVAEALALRLTGGQRESLRKRYTDDIEAYQAYSSGRYFWDKRSGEGVRKATEYFQRAINLDPNYALAYAGLADCYVSGHLGLPPREGYAKAEAAALKALQLDDSLAEAHTSLAITRFYAWDWPGAEREYRRAIELDPNCAAAHEWYAFYLESVGRMDEGFAEIHRALALNPLSLTINTGLGRMFYSNRQYDHAIAQYRKTLELDPNILWVRLRLGQALSQKGLGDESLAEFRKAREVLPASSGADVVSIRLAQAQAFLGQRDEAKKILDQWKRLPPSGSISLQDVAIIYVGLGEIDEAFALLERACAERDVHLASLKSEPRFDPIRSDPRYAELLRRLGLPM
ncbi:MAG TPA: tetratricopeptide repeat protein [Blastocatellia bacterium]|jgi:DNA-binding winged helix-turn-helix (wHTH) protein/TolB-like protein/Flp pilus assembly protein TadD|nr:tetratricopeptide repeat protein [Blastocatellia bacterium]